MALAELAMTVSGLDRDRYLINNPIWVDVAAVPSNAIYVRVTIEPLNQPTTNLPNSLRLHPLNGKLYFDLSEGIKTFFNVPDFSSETANNAAILTNYEAIRVTLAAISETGAVLQSLQYVRTYIRGGRDGTRTNLSLGQTAVLKESTLLPRWGAYPVRKYYLASVGVTRVEQYAIYSTTTIPSAESEQRKVLGCNPIYFKFLNTNGGYSYWLFEKWEAEEDVGKAELVSSRDIDYSLGGEVEYELEVESRVERRYFKTMRALAQSTEVYVYNLENKVFNDITGTLAVASRGSAWGKVYGVKNKVDFSNGEDVKEVKFKFQVINKNRPTLKW